MARQSTARAPRPREDPQPQTFTMPLLGALYASTVVVIVIFILNTDVGRAIEDDLEAPARTLVAAPVVILATVVFAACMVALLAPGYRRHSMRVAELAGWLIPAWLLMAGTTLAAIAYALDRIQ
jgi:hypothetical protein